MVRPLAFLVLLAAALAAAGEAPAPVEWGGVAWERDFDAALARARETGRSLLLLFQEVPG